MVRQIHSISQEIGRAFGQAGLYYLFCLVLFCFGATVVYVTPTKQRRVYLWHLSAPLQYWIFLSE